MATGIIWKANSERKRAVGPLKGVLHPSYAWAGHNACRVQGRSLRRAPNAFPTEPAVLNHWDAHAQIGAVLGSLHSQLLRKNPKPASSESGAG